MSYETKQANGCCDILVTDVKIFPFKCECIGMNHVRALANIVLNDAIIIRGLRITEGANKLFLSYPTDSFFNGMQLRSAIIPLKRKLSEYIENEVLKQYQKEFANG